LIIFHQLMLIGSGNYSWLNWLSIVLGVTLFTDSQFAFLGMESGSAQPIPDMFNYVLIAFGALILVLSIKPLVNLLKRQQLMNFSFNPYHIVNTYGAFGSVTKKRYELIIEGSGDEEPTEHSEWREYEFKGKPG